MKLIKLLILVSAFYLSPGVGGEPIDKRILMDIQKALQERGYNPGPVDGKFGDNTKNAIRAFNRDSGAPIVSHISESLAEALGINWDQWRPMGGKVSSVEFSRKAEFSISSLESAAEIKPLPRWFVEIRLASEPGIWFEFLLDDILVQPDFKHLVGKPGSALVEVLVDRSVELERLHSSTIKSGNPEGREYGYESRSLSLH